MFLHRLTPLSAEWDCELIAAFEQDLLGKFAL
jgi:hypothetical protein